MFNQRGLSRWGFKTWLKLRRQHWNDEGNVVVMWCPDRFEISYLTFAGPETITKMFAGVPQKPAGTIEFKRWLR